MWLGHSLLCMVMLVCSCAMVALHLTAYLQDPGYTPLPDAGETIALLYYRPNVSAQPCLQECRIACFVLHELSRIGLTRGVQSFAHCHVCNMRACQYNQSVSVLQRLSCPQHMPSLACTLMREPAHVDDWEIRSVLLHARCAGRFAILHVLALQRKAPMQHICTPLPAAASAAPTEVQTTAKQRDQQQAVTPVQRHQSRRRCSVVTNRIRLAAVRLDPLGEVPPWTTVGRVGSSATSGPSTARYASECGAA
jgi:hypothetical protein